MCLCEYFIADVNECTDMDSVHNCDDDATCTNTDGSFECKCKVGFIGNGVSCSGKVSVRCNSGKNCHYTKCAVTVGMLFRKCPRINVR